MAKFNFIEKSNINNVLASFYLEKFNKDIEILNVIDKDIFIEFHYKLDGQLIKRPEIFPKDEILKYSIKSKLKHLTSNLCEIYLERRCEELVSLVKSVF